MGKLAAIALTACMVSSAVGSAADEVERAAQWPAGVSESERDCRQACARWLMPQCNPQTMRRGETMFECTSRLAPIFDDCMRRCRR
jgi:hypothetical protein